MDGLVYTSLRTASTLVRKPESQNGPAYELGLVSNESRNLNLLERHHSIYNDGG
jgi:hypothetical protein